MNLWPLRDHLLYEDCLRSGVLEALLMSFRSSDPVFKEKGLRLDDPAM